MLLAHHGEVGIVHVIVHPDPDDFPFRDVQLRTGKSVVDQRGVSDDATNAVLLSRDPEHMGGREGVIVHSWPTGNPCCV